MQKELSEVYDLMREVRTRMGVIAADIDSRVVKFEDMFNTKIKDMQYKVD